MGHMTCTEPQCLYKGALYLYLTEEYHEEPQDKLVSLQHLYSKAY